MEPKIVKRVDAFTRWLVKKEAANRAKDKPSYDQTRMDHTCGTPACMGGYLNTYYPPFVRKGDIGWGGYFGLSWLDETKVFGVEGCNGARTALQAANFLRRAAKLPRLTRADTK